MIHMMGETDGNGSAAADEMEICIVCGCMTDVPKNRPISLRKNYVQGGGQLCGECFRHIYHTDDVRP